MYFFIFMVQFRDKTQSSMLALCTHAAQDAYIYVNCAESHKTLLKTGNPHFSPPSSSHSCSSLCICEENP